MHFSPYQQMLQIMNRFGTTSKIRSLDFSGCEGLTNSELSLFPSGLEELNFSRCRWILAPGLNNLPPSITSLDISACPS